MIVVKLMGGLGNQMFQYALGRRLAHDRDVPLKLDLSWFSSQQLRKYQLDCFNLKAEIASIDEINDLLRRSQTDLFSRFRRKARSYFPFLNRNFVRQKGRLFDPRILQAPSNIYLEGYWQSEKYFQPIGYIIRKELTYNGPISESGQRMIEIIEASTSVSIHIRRGDYFSDIRTKQHHGVNLSEYYNNAIKFFQSSIGDCHFIVFSDEPEWVMENLQIPGRVTYIPRDSEDIDTEHLFLMSQCNHNIIANSTYSWWAAWLNNSSQKVVVAPLDWFKDPESNRITVDLIPKEWKRL
jgi:hypothetical protein